MGDDYYSIMSEDQKENFRAYLQGFLGLDYWDMLRACVEQSLKDHSEFILNGKVEYMNTHASITELHSRLFGEHGDSYET